MNLRLSLLIVIASATICFPQQSSADLDGYGLRDDLRISSNPNATANAHGPFAVGYVMGVAETFDRIEWCIPEQVRQGEISDVAEKFLNDHPEQLHRSRAAVVVAALAEAYPCAAGQRKYRLVSESEQTAGKSHVLGEVPLPK